MAEALKQHVARLHALDVRRHVGEVTDLVEHADDLLVGAAVERAVQTTRGRGDRRVRIGPAGAHGAHRGGAAVLLVVGVEDEQDGERPGEDGIRFVVGIRDIPHHPQEVAGVAEVVHRVLVRQTDPILVGERRHRGHLRDEALALDPAVVLVVDVFGLGVKGAERRNGGHQRAHRMRVVPETLHELGDVLVHVGVHRDFVHPEVGLLLVGKLAVEKQIADLEEARLLGELLDGVAAVAQDALGAVDVGDLAFAVRRGQVGRVVEPHALVELTQRR